MDQNIKIITRLFCLILLILGAVGKLESGSLISNPICKDVISNYREFYSKRNILSFSIAFSSGAIFANTSFDRHFQHWYQVHGRSSYSYDISKGFKFFGEGDYLIPISVAVASLRLLPEDSQFIQDVSSWGYKTARTYFLGAPPVLLLQRLTGGSRPGENENKSSWHPFEDDNGVSGHAFIGAVPFLTFAKMNENNKSIYWLANIFSALPGWSRIHDNQHYLSQAFLGWFIAWRSTQAIFSSKVKSGGLSLIPLINMEKIGLICEYKF